jgi:hypothetical protein
MPKEEAFRYSGSSIIYVVVFYDSDDNLIGQMSYDEPIPIPSEGESIDLKEYHYGRDAADDEFIDIIGDSHVVEGRSTTYQYMIPDESESDIQNSENEERETPLVAIRKLRLSAE